MYFDDHPPPHFHVITRDNERVTIRISTLEVWAGEADSRDIEEALVWAAANRQVLEDRWMQYSEEE
jgi:hypothetical protein